MIVSIVLAIGSQAAALVAILLTRSVVTAIRHDELHKLKWLVAVVVALGVARALMMSGRRLIAGKQALAVELDLRRPCTRSSSGSRSASTTATRPDS